MGVRGFYDGHIDIVIDIYICAQCYEGLIKTLAPGRRWFAVCPTHGNIEDLGVGRVTKAWAEQRGQEGVMELDIVRHNLRDLFPEEKAEEVDEEQLLTELGF